MVDGDLKVLVRGVEFRGTGSEDTLIQKFLFATFHDGNNARWAPKTPSGEFTTVHALFDDIEIKSFNGVGQPMSIPMCADS